MKNALCLALIIAAAQLAGCAHSPTRTGPPAQALARDIQLPIKAGLAIYMAPEDVNRAVRITGRYYGYWFEEGRTVEEAAVMGFGRFFERAAPCGQITAPDVIVQVKGYGSYNPQMTTYYADVEATFYLANGEAMGTVSADARTGGFMSNYSSAFPTVFAAAFLDIGNRMIENARFIEAIRAGFRSPPSRQHPCGFLGPVTASRPQPVPAGQRAY